MIAYLGCPMCGKAPVDAEIVAGKVWSVRCENILHRASAYSWTSADDAAETWNRRTPPAGGGEAVRVDAVALDRALQAFFAEQRYTMTPAEKDTLRIGLVDALSDLPPKGRFCDEGHTLEWCARDLMEAVNAYHRTTSGNDSRRMDSAARRVAVALAAPTPLPEAVLELVELVRESRDDAVNEQADARLPRHKERAQRRIDRIDAALRAIAGGVS